MTDEINAALEAIWGEAYRFGSDGGSDYHEKDAVFANARAAIEAHEARKVSQASVAKQEPVAWRVPVSVRHHNGTETHSHQFRSSKCSEHDEPLYTHPAPVREPLTPEQVSQLLQIVGYDAASPKECADFINGIRHGEVAHGITKDTPKPRKASADFDLPAPNDDIGDTQ